MPSSFCETTVCETCRRTLPDLVLKRRYKHDHHRSLRALKASSIQGCRSCAIFYHNFAYTSYQEAALGEGPIAIGRSSKDNTFKVTLNGASNEVAYGADIPFSVELATSTEQHAQTYLSQAADSVENVALVKTLLEDCLSNHPLCTAARESVEMPTRVLDVSPTEHKDIVKIVPGSDVQGHGGRYVCLSHCWGIVPQDAPWKLTESRQKTYMTEISMSILPPTFQQAIQYTRSLGERYLWIDSLCIIQDSAADWAAEASKMAMIYTNSLFTVSAATSSSSEGCILKRERSLVDPVVLSLGSDGVNSQKAYICHGVPDEKQLLQKVPVTSRAWCLQERKLTVRLVQFTSYQWTWSCRTTSTSERILRKLHITASNFNNEGVKGLTFHDQEDKSGSRVTRSDGNVDDESVVKQYKDSRRSYDPWYQIVEEFTRCNITYSTDRLPALAGLAQRQRSRVPDTYLAGLWESDMCYGLVWSSKNPPRERPTTYIAPSWSWVSINSAVTFNGFLHHTDETSPTLITAANTHDSPDTLGMIKAGHLRLKGRLKPMAASTVVPGFAETFREFPTGHGAGILQLDTYADAINCDDLQCLPALEGRGIALKRRMLDRETERPAYTRVGSTTCPVEMFQGIEEVEFDLY